MNESDKEVWASKLFAKPVFNLKNCSAQLPAHWPTPPALQFHSLDEQNAAMEFAAACSRNDTSAKDCYDAMAQIYNEGGTIRAVLNAAK